MSPPSPITLDEVRLIGRRYGLVVKTAVLLSGGHANVNYQVKTDERPYVLTLFVDDSYEDAIQLSQLLLWLGVHNFRTMRLYPAGADDLFVTWYQEWPCLIREFIPGRILPTLNEPLLMQVGAEMARLHQVPPAPSMPDHHRNVLLLPDLVANTIDPGYGNWLAEQEAIYQQHLARAGGDLPRGLTHGDIFCDNVLFLDNQLQAIIDFSAACHDYFLLDIATAIVGTCVRETAVSLELVRALLTGYQQIRPLSLAEQHHLQSFVVYAAVLTSTWRFWNYNIANPDPAQRDWFQQMVRLAEQVNGIPAAQFLRAIFE